MARRYSAEQTQQFVKQYKENRKKGFKDYKNNSAGGYAGDATGTRLHALTLDSPKQKRIVKEFDNSDMYVGPGKSWREQDTGTANNPVVYSSDNEIPELKTSSTNLRDQGYPGSMNNNQIDFRYMLTNVDKDDFSGNGLYASSIDRLDKDLTARNKERNRSDFVSEYLPFLSGLSFSGSNMGKEAERAANEEYYRKFGMSKDQVLDQYETWKEDQERQNREDHFIVSGLKDFPSAPDRAILGGAKNFTQKHFGNSTLANMISHPYLQDKVNEVERQRDYTQDSEKLSEGKKNFAKFYNETGDWLTIKALESLIGSYGALGDASAGIGAMWEGNKALARAIGSVMMYGSEAENTRHALERNGVDEDKALSMANLAGLGAAGTNLLMNKAFKAGEGILTSALKSAGLMGTKQSLKEIADALILEDQGTYANDVNNYMAQGLSEEEAGEKASMNLLGRVAGATASGGIFGVISGLIGKLPSLFGNSAPGTSLTTQGVSDDGLNTVYGDFQKAIGTQTPGLIEEYTGQSNLPMLSNPGSVIEMPNTSSGPPIIMPNTGSGPVIQLPDLSAPAVSTSAPTNVTTSAPVANPVTSYAPLQGEELAAAQQRYAEVRKELSARRAQVNTMKQLKQTKDMKKKIEAENKLIKKLDQERKELDRKIKGTPTPIRELLSKDDYNDLFNGYKSDKNVYSIDNAINYTIKYAGDTPEAKALGKELKSLLKDFVEAGDINLIDGLYDKASALDELARTVNAEFKGSNMYPYYEDAFEGTSLQERILLSDALNNAYVLGNERRKAATIPMTMDTPKDVPVLTEPAQDVSAQAVAPEVGGTSPNANAVQNVDFKPSIHNADGQLLDTVRVPEYSADNDVFFNGSDTDVALAEAQEAAITETFRNIISDPDFNALSFKNGRQEVYVSPSTTGTGYRMSYTVDGVPTGHHDYSLEEIDDLSRNLREMAGNGGEDIRVQRKSDILRQPTEGENAPIEDDVIDEDITPEIETRPAVTRDYSPEEQAKLNDYLARREELNAQVTEATSHLLTTDPQELSNLFAQIDAVNAEMQKDFPELFENGKYIGIKSGLVENAQNSVSVPPVDNTQKVPFDPEVQKSIKAIPENELPELNEPDAEPKYKSYDDVVREEALLEEKYPNLRHYSDKIVNVEKTKVPSDVIEHMKGNLYEIASEGEKLAAELAMRGYNVMENGGNNTLVFDLWSDMLDAVEHSLTVKRIPAAIMAEAYDVTYQNGGTLADAINLAADMAGTKVFEGDRIDAGNVKLRGANARAIGNAKKSATVQPQNAAVETNQPAQPENVVPDLEQPTVNDGQSYYLRLLGDDAFLAEQAQISGMTPAELRALASYNLGYGDLPDLQGPPNVPPTSEPTPPANGPVPPSNEGPIPPSDGGANGEAPKKKTSQYYKNSMRNTEQNQKKTDEEYAEAFPKSHYSYTVMPEDRSVNEAHELIKSLGGIEKATKTLSNPAYFEGREFTGVHVDALETLADLADLRAESLIEQGLSPAEAYRDADRLHQMAKRGLSNSGQAMQAVQKWKKPSPRAQVDRLASEINAEIDRKKTKGYTNMVTDLSNAVEDAILKGGSTEEIIERVRKVFEANGKKSNYNTKKVAEKVIRYIRNAEKNPDLVEEASKIIKSNMGVSTMTYQEEIAIAELLEQANQFQPGTRSYDLLVAQAMAMFDETLPPDSLGAKAKSIIYDNMLASIRTMATRNMGGNVGNALIDTLERPLMVGADVIASKFTGNRTRTLSGRAIVEGLYGFKKGLTEWGGDIKEGVNTGRSGQKDLKTVLAQNHNVFRTKSNNKVVKGANIAFHVYDRLVKKGMELGDRPIYEMRYAQTKAELLDVVDRFGDEGLRRGLGLEGAQDMDVNDLIEFISTGEALEAVLQNDSKLKNAAKSLKKFFKESSEGVLGMDVASMSMAPFVEVPSNMADVMFQHTPIGIVSNIIKSRREKRKYGSVNQRRMTKEAGRNIGGLIGTAATMGLAAAGLTSGAFSGDKDEKKVQQNNGFQEYALQNKEGTTQVDISDIPIAGPMVQYGKRLWDAYQEGGVTGALKEQVPALSAVAIDQLYQSLNRLTGGTQNSSSTKGNFIGNVIDSVAAGAASMAVPAVVRQTAQFLDPYKRDLGDYGTSEYYKNLLINGIPVLRENMLEPKVDTSGNYVPELGGKEGLARLLAAYVTPWKVSHPYDNMSDVQKYAMELNLSSDGEVNPQTPVFNKNDLVSTKGFDAENYTHAQLREADEEFYKANAELGSLLINQSWFRELSPELQGKYLDKLFSANKANTKYNAVRKGKTAEEIEKLGDELYQTDNGLAKVIREDNSAHTKMLTWIMDQAKVDLLNEKYGTDIGHSTYANKENEQKGAGEAWIRDSVPAHELGYNTDDYQRYEATYPGGARQRKADEAEAQRHNLSLDQYNNLKGKAGQNFDAALNAADELRRRGFDNYKVGLDYTRSDFPMDEFVDLYRQVDTNFNQQLSQSEVVDYLNAYNIGDELAQRIWAIGGFKNQDGTDKPLGKTKGGKWKY